MNKNNRTGGKTVTAKREKQWWKMTLKDPHWSPAAACLAALELFLSDCYFGVTERRWYRPIFQLLMSTAKLLVYRQTRTEHVCARRWWGTAQALIFPVDPVIGAEPFWFISAHKAHRSGGAMVTEELFFPTLGQRARVCAELCLCISKQMTPGQITTICFLRW